MATLRSLQFLTHTIGSFCRLQVRPATAALPINISIAGPSTRVVVSPLRSLLADCLWLAVPKKKVSRHKKRLKTTVQKRIPLNRNIVTDPRTGEVTLQHKMPANWRDYLPEA